MSGLELEYHRAFSQRVANAVDSLLGDQTIAHRIRGLCGEYEQQCESIAGRRGVPLLTVAIVGAKGQGKSWVARQFLRSQSLRDTLPSGVLAKEATTKLYWIGPMAPESMDSSRESYLHCDAKELSELGQPYMLLDTPGVTDSDPAAAAATRSVLALAPIKLLVLRRDQIRSSIQSEIAAWIEGAVCLPVITCIPLGELDPGQEAPKFDSTIASDLRKLMDWLQASAPHTQLLDPVLVEDFEASGKEAQAGELLIARVAQKIRTQPLENLSRTRANRLAALHAKFRRDVSRSVESQAPYLGTAVRRLHEEAERLPSLVVESVLGAPLILETAVRGRLRAQMINDTSALWFPFRAILSLLGFTQGAWDRLLLALTGSVPSIFGTLASWARNVQQSRKITFEIQEGIRDRMSRQVEDRLEPIHRQFHAALHALKEDEPMTQTASDLPKVRLAGIEELQTQSRALFETKVDASSMPSFPLQVTGALATIGFWGMMSGPIVSVYRQYFHASYEALWKAESHVSEFPHPSPSMLGTSILLSSIPLLLFAMIIMAFVLRRAKIRKIARTILNDHHSLVEDLKHKGVLRMNYEDRALEQAEFLIRLDRHDE